jgi:outer membrane protein assembly factor BamB
MRRLLCLTALALIGLFVGPLSQVVAQIKGIAVQLDRNNPDADAPDGVFLPPDRNAKRRLDLAREMLDGERYGESVRYLGSLLEGSEDFFFKPDPKQQLYRSLKIEAARLLGEMPAEGRESYELQFGARARKMLDDAIAKGDLAAVTEVSRRFFYTKAGNEATLLVGRMNWDRGQPLAAALCLDRLRGSADAQRFEPMLSVLLATCWHQAGEDDRAKQVLLALKQQSPLAELHLGNRTSKLFSDNDQALAWLEQQTGPLEASLRASKDEWLVFRGDAARTAESRGSLPLLNARWRVRCADHPRVAEAIVQLRRAYHDQSIAALPSAQPLAVGNVILMRTTRNLLAVDFATGKRVWEPPVAGDDSLDQLLAFNSERKQLGLPAELLSIIDQRVWGDVPFGTLASDGENVYAVQDLGFSAPTVSPRRIVNFNGQMQIVGAGLRDYNRLSALELKTEGKLKWEVGGVEGEDEPKLAGAFFLGPPLPLAGRLYALAEIKGQEIRLVVLNAQSGKLEWSQQLAVVEQNVLQDPFRRWAGAMPSFADGVLVCPTSAGAIVGIDLTTRSLLWGFQYPRGGEEEMDRLQVFRAGMFNPLERHGHDRWVDATVTITGGKVLVTPVESNTLYCLNLLDGKLAWKQDRGNNLYVAGVRDGKIILVGRQAMTAVNLADGQSAWEHALELPSGAAPSGRGFLSGDNYFLPLSSGHVAQVDLNKRAIVSQSRSRYGNVPGNLICFHGEVISQGADFLESFYQLDALRNEVTARLQTDGDDPQALLRYGEIQYDAGNLAEAVKLFRKAHALAPDETTNDLLVESLLDLLRQDFAANRSNVEELEKLLTRRSHRLAFLRLLAEGLRKSGEPLAAFDAFIRLADLHNTSPDTTDNARGSDGKQADLDEISEDLLVARDRWLRVQFAALRDAAKPADREVIDRKLAERVEKMSATGDVDELRRGIEIAGSHPSADALRQSLVDRLGGSDTLLERERLLLQLAGGKNTERHPAALARLASLYAEAKQPDLAAKTYQRLASQWPDAVALDGKTGKQLLEAIPEGAVKDALAEAKPWPVGLVEPRTDRPKRTLPGNRYQRSFDLAFNGNSKPFFEDSTMMLDPRQQSLVCQDQFGNERFRLNMGDPNARRNLMPFNNPQFNSISVDGHLLVYSMGFQTMAFDTLRPLSSPAKSLWMQELNEQFGGMQANFGVHQRLVSIAWGDNRVIAQDAYGRPLGTMGPVGKDGIVMQRFRDLLCLDPLTGRVQWQRRNAPPGCQLFGDEELLIAAPFEGGEGLVLRALDGELLGRCRVAPLEQRMATIGRQLLTWQADGGRSTMSLVDPWKNDTLWTHHFAPNSKADVVRDEAVGVLEPNGMFSLFKLPSGERLIHEQLVKERALTSIILLPSADQYLLVTNSPPRNVDPRAPVQPAPGGLNNPLVNGRVYAFNRATGAKQWLAPVRVQNHGLLVAQPSGLPVLVFLRAVHRAVGGTSEMKTSILAIDKRNGKVVYKNDDLKGNLSNVEFVGDRAESTVNVLMPGKTITLTLTDKPIPPDAAPTEEKPKSDENQVGRAIGGIFRALDNATRRVSGLPTIEEEQDPFGDKESADSEEETPSDAAEDAAQENADPFGN